MDDYKKRYYDILRNLSIMKTKTVCNKCPIFHQCCGMCNDLEYWIKKEKDGGYSGDSEEI